MANLVPPVVYDPPESDPNWASVIAYLKGDGNPAITNSYTVFDKSQSQHEIISSVSSGTSLRSNTSTSYGSFSPYENSSAGSVMLYGAWSYLVKSVANANARNDFLFTGDYTVEAWVYITGQTAAPTSINTMTARIFGTNIVLQINSYNDTYGDCLAIRNGEIHWSWKMNSAGTQIDKAAFFPNFVTLTDYRKWIHVAATRSGSTVKIFKNGNEFATWQYSGTVGKAYATTDNTANTFKIGGGVDSSYGYAHIAGCNILNGIAKYTSNFTPPVEPPVPENNTVLLLDFDSYFIKDSTNKFNYVTNEVYDSATNYLANDSTNKKIGNSSIKFYTLSSSNLARLNITTHDSYGYYTIPEPFALGQGPFSIECWVNPTKTGLTGVSTLTKFLLFQYSLGSNQALSIYIDSTGKVCANITGFTTFSTANTYYSLTFNCSKLIPFDNWSHIMLTRSSNGLTYNWYVNYEKQTTVYPAGYVGSTISLEARNIKTTVISTTSTSMKLNIGGIDTTRPYYSISGLTSFSGNLQEFKITKAERIPTSSASQLLELTYFDPSISSTVMSNSTVLDTIQTDLQLNNIVATSNSISDTSLFEINTNRENIKWD